MRKHARMELLSQEETLIYMADMVRGSIALSHVGHVCREFRSIGLCDFAVECSTLHSLRELFENEDTY